MAGQRTAHVSHLGLKALMLNVDMSEILANAAAEKQMVSFLALEALVLPLRCSVKKVRSISLAVPYGAREWSSALGDSLERNQVDALLSWWVRD
jgi:hypothetical protein